MDHRKQLGQLLSRTGIIKAPGIYDGLTALLVEQAGFEAAFISGAGLSFSRLGQPDMGLMSFSEMSDAVSQIRERTTLPLIVDIDTGFGNAINVQRTVKTFERAGASALQIEDQMMPKRCGHMKGKSVVSKEEMVGKIKSALDARESDDTVIIARTDALGVEGFEAALDRAMAYRDAGADGLFIEAPTSIEQMLCIGEKFGSQLPLVHNFVEGGSPHIEEFSTLCQLHYKIALYPVALLHGLVPMARSLLAHISQTGQTREWQGDLIDLSEINEILGAEILISQGKSFGL